MEELDYYYHLDQAPTDQEEPEKEKEKLLEDVLSEKISELYSYQSLKSVNQSKD